jgi:hypothetical protein
MATQIESIIEQMKDIKSRDRRTRFQVEPGRGETYCDGKPTVYAYNTYPRSSVLSGQERRIWVDRFDEPVNLDEFVLAARKAGIRVDVMAGSCFRPVNLNHLPDDTDY